MEELYSQKKVDSLMEAAIRHGEETGMNMLEFAAAARSLYVSALSLMCDGAGELAAKAIDGDA